ncbi:hypothetical protein M2132_001881 [Dysgonomonas sp. PH5-45]|uniref:hypothetical protein n=1 Tax=unclassified Dysgonomonas TaxID=2630389 RepID=UPI002476F528|nr:MULTISPECIES: hypothetical protein [unclassified Dysgonomonas]MDH6355536.1 hypothetical protein [Dysgonomonas sp. PH5-45]MDH6388403.1 hypothetical protein [Dysgonomonas sp. PH5-37]
MSQYLLQPIIEEYLSELKSKIEYVFYAKALSSLVKDRLRIEANLKEASIDIEKEIYKSLIAEVNILISRYWNLQFNLLNGRTNYDVVDALGALMILDIKQAKNVLYHASIYSNNSRQISFQTLLDDLMIIHNKKVVIPCLNKRLQNGNFEISFIEKETIEKDLHETHFKGHDYTPEYTLKHGTINNYYEIGKRLLRFLKHFDWGITKKDLLILYITLTQISKEKTTPLEIDLVRDRINGIFLTNKGSNRKFCVLLALSRNYITSMIDLQKSLSEYFTQGTGLSSSTLRTYLSDGFSLKDNIEKYEDEVKYICKI